MSGLLYGIGVGPGDPELLTLKALRCIGESDVVLLPAAPKEECVAYQIVKKAYPEIDKKELVCLPFPMSHDRAVLAKAHHAIYKKIAAYLAGNHTVAFLTIGDPCVYSTYHYIHRQVTANGGCAVIINGVPSFCAAAGVFGISLGDNREEIHIIPGSYDISETLTLDGTRIYMKSGRKLAMLKCALQKQEKERALEIYCVENCGMEQERRMTGTESLDPASGYLTLVIVKDAQQKGTEDMESLKGSGK